MQNSRAWRRFGEEGARRKLGGGAQRKLGARRGRLSGGDLAEKKGALEGGGGNGE